MSALIDLGPHAAFILWAYGIAAAVLAGLIGWIVTDYRRQLRRLAQLEAAGITRRSSRKRTQSKAARA
jgi:heme exporter protein D